MKIILILKKTKHLLFLASTSIKRQHRKIFNKPLIYVFGDSHTMNFQHELFITTHVGPATAYKLFSDTSTTQAKKKINTVLDKLSKNRKHYFLFVFGEIDCRIHINKVSRATQRPLGSVINDTVISYIFYLKNIQQHFPHSTIMVLNVLPAGEEKNIYHTKFYPSKALHQKIVSLFNSQLLQKCNENKFIFISVFNQLIDSSNNRRKSYIFDDIHFNKQIIPFITNEISQKAELI